MSKNPPAIKVDEIVKDPIKPAVRDLGALAKKLTHIDAKTGAPTDASQTKIDEFYASSLPEDIKKEFVEKLKAHDSTFVAGVALGTGNAAMEAFKKNPELNVVTVIYPTVGKDSFTVTVKREGKVPDRNAAEGEPATRSAYGMVSVEANIFGAKSRGQLKHVKDEMGALYMDAFGKS